MSTRATSTFEITRWDESAYAEPMDGPKLSRVTVFKTFKGDLEGESTAELLMTQADDGSAGYLAQEYVVGRLDGRTGSFVIQHGGASAGTPRAFAFIVPGTATGELRGLTGEAEYRHDEDGAVLTLEYDLEEPGLA